MGCFTATTFQNFEGTGSPTTKDDMNTHFHSFKDVQGKISRFSTVFHRGFPWISGIFSRTFDLFVGGIRRGHQIRWPSMPGQFACGLCYQCLRLHRFHVTQLHQTHSRIFHKTFIQIIDYIFIQECSEMIIYIQSLSLSMYMTSYFWMEWALKQTCHLQPGRGQG